MSQETLSVKDWMGGHDGTAVMPAPRPLSARVVTYGCLVVGMIAAMAFLDRPVATWVHDQMFPAAFKTVLRFVRMPGHFGFTIALAAFAVWAFRSSWRGVGVMLLAGMAAGMVAALVKLCAGRLRPFRGREAFDWHWFSTNPFDGVGGRNLSFPSGDATLAFATAAVFAVLVPKYRWPAFAWAAAVAVTRVLQGAHYPSDVIAGAIVGIVTADALASLTRPRPVQTRA